MLAGCGGQSRLWTASLPAGVELAGFVDVDREAAARRAEGFDGAVVDTDLRAVLRRVRPHVVLDCTPPEAHLGVTLMALGAGCHVLGEKPMADSLEHARLMIGAARSAGRVYAVSQNFRFRASVRRLRRLLEALGPLTSVHADLFVGPHFGGFRDRMAHPLLLDMAIHHFDVARSLTGADPVAVWCREWNPPGSWYDGDAAAVCVFELTDGLVFSYRGSWCAEGRFTGWNGEWRLLGTRGTATWLGEQHEPRAEVVAGAGGFFSEHEAVPLPPLEGDDEEGVATALAHFFDCLASGEAPETACEDNVKSLAMVFAAIDSARTGARVPVRW